MARTRWQAAPDRRDEARQAAAQTGVHPVVAHILLNRGLSAEQFAGFLSPSAATLGDPSLLADLDRAAARLALAVRERQKVCIYGDYDADGTTAAAILTRFLARSGVPFAYHLPDRFAEGYGVHAASLIRLLAAEKPALLVTVDCGIAAAEEIDTAVALGCDVIVTDHHQVPERLPAVPAVDPHRADCRYPFKELCGAALAAKLCCAAAAELGGDAAAWADELLDLVVIGTVADVMPLVGENRYLAKSGLRALGETQSVGLRALFEVAHLDPARLTARDIGFGIGPRLNAAGRLEHARLAYELLVTDDRGKAFELAETLERLNRERREIEERLVGEAETQLAEVSLHETWGLVVGGDGWHEGVLGLVAGRICRRHTRPALAVSRDGERARGSGRGIDGLDLHAALGCCAEVLTQFGGHTKAAGFTLPAANLPALGPAFDAAVKLQLSEDDLVPRVLTECPVRGGAVSLELVRELDRLAPFGEGNREPLLEVRGLKLATGRATRDGAHLQLQFEDEKGRTLKGFWPREGQLAQKLPLGAAVKVAACLRVDAWNGREQPQLVVSDLKRDGAGAHGG